MIPKRMKHLEGQRVVFRHAPLGSLEEVDGRFAVEVGELVITRAHDTPASTIIELSITVPPAAFPLITGPDEDGVFLLDISTLEQ